MSKHTVGQSGFSLVSAVFLLVVLAALGAYMVSVSGVQRTTTTLALQGARAQQAARSGIEWAVYRALNGNVTQTCGNAPSTPLTNTLPLSGSGLDGFTVDVTCSYTRHQEGSACFYVFALEAHSEYASFGRPDYVSRRIRATVTDRPAPITACP